MGLTNVDPSLKRELQQRKLFLRAEDVGHPWEVVYVCVDDGHPGGFPVGHVMPAGGRPPWSAYARVRPHSPFSNDKVAAGLPSMEAAIRIVLAHAHYGDIMAALEHDSGTYTAKVHEVHAEWLASLDEPRGITRLGNDRVRFTSAAVAYLRSLPDHLDCHLDSEDRLWIAGDPYKLTRDR